MGKLPINGPFSTAMLVITGGARLPSRLLLLQIQSGLGAEEREEPHSSGLGCLRNSADTCPKRRDHD